MKQKKAHDYLLKSFEQLRGRLKKQFNYSPYNEATNSIHNKFFLVDQDLLTTRIEILGELRNLKRKFPNLTSDELTPLQKQAYSYAKERFGFEDAKNSLDQIKTLTTREEFSDWVQKKIEAENSLNEEKSRTAKEVFRSIEANDLLNDRREYDVEDLMVAYPGLSEKEAEKLEDMLQNPNLDEAEDTEKDTAETDATDVTVDDTETVDVETTAEVDPNVKAVQDALTQAQAAAEQLGDKKLTDQIGNTITFFTRSHVVEKGAVAENITESMFPMLKKILK